MGRNRIKQSKTEGRQTNGSDPCNDRNNETVEMQLVDFIQCDEQLNNCSPETRVAYLWRGTINMFQEDNH